MTQCINPERRRFAAIKTERHFLKISREMLCADLVPCSHDAALEQRESRLDSVCVNVAVNIDLAGMLNRFVFCSSLSSAFHRIGVRSKVIRHQDFNICAHVLLNVLRQSAGLYIFSVEE